VSAHHPAPLCPGCFATEATRGACPTCGYEAAAPRPPAALTAGIELHGQFIIGRVLGRPGGFGITYLGLDRHLEARVAIKEFLPRELATRAADGSTIVPHGTEDAELLRYGLTQFLGEARTLARLNHPNIVRVRQFFEANGSAYLVMDYYPGQTLGEFLERQPGGRLPEATALALMAPILDGLRAVHSKGFLHRDIKPQNIYLARTDSGGTNPVLIDFGAAREALGERSLSMSVMVSAGYAPLEQYSRKGQGTYTDVYAAAAVLYRMLTGQTPAPASERVMDDELQPASAFGITPALSDAIGQAMAMRPAQRLQTIEALQGLLAPRAVAAPPPPAPAVPPPVAAAPASVPAAGSVAEVQGLGTAQVQALQQAAAKALGLGVVFRDPAFRVRVTERIETGQRLVRKRLFGPDEYEPVYEMQERLVSVPPPELVIIPAGSFTMGSPDTEAGRSACEGPLHRVTFAAPFALGRYAVTFDEYDAFCAATARESPKDWGWGRGRRPVIQVSRDDAQAYATWLSKATGKGYRLPSEAEWEYACRAGTKTPFSTGHRIQTNQANYDGTYGYADSGAEPGVALQRTQPVGSYPANPWGLYDMHGNVWEWVQDCWQNNYTGAPKDGSAGLDGCGISRRPVLRGGSWNSLPQYLRSAGRFGYGTGYRDFKVGFRLARTLIP